MDKISICIPAYNGEEYITRTVHWLKKALDNDSNTEVIINDDCSTDSTYNIIKKISEEDNRFVIYKNEKNLGMDLNFIQTVSLSEGKYIWLLGQDDYISENALHKAREIINQYNPNFIFWNYFFFNNENSLDVDGIQVKNRKSEFFEFDKDFLEYSDQAPSFLGANFMKKEFYYSDFSRYFNTYYIQMGVWLESLSKGSIYFEGNHEYIGCRMPDESWKVNNSQMLFGTPVGNMYVYYANIDNGEEYRRIYKAKRKRFLLKIFPKLLLFKADNLIIKDEIMYMISEMFGKYHYVTVLSKIVRGLPNQLFYFLKPVYKLFKFLKKQRNR